MAAKGRARKTLDWKVLDALVQFKVSCRFCAEHMGISEDTIQRRIKTKYKMTFEEYKKMRSENVGLKLQQKAIQMALSGNTVMMIFCLKNLANWSDKVEQQITGNSVSINISEEDAEL